MGRVLIPTASNTSPFDCFRLSPVQYAAMSICVLAPIVGCATEMPGSGVTDAVSRGEQNTLGAATTRTAERRKYELYNISKSIPESAKPTGC